VALREEIRMDETQEKSVVERARKEKIGNAIDRLDLLHRPFINQGDYGGSARALRIRDDLLTLWRERPDPPPPLPWPSEALEMEEFVEEPPVLEEGFIRKIMETPEPGEVESE
jgi:hypothetical protein